MSEHRRRLLTRVIVIVCSGLAIYYATLGGEYSAFDVRDLRTRTARLATRVDSLNSLVDSLESWSDRLTSDPVAIERVARERYGFLKDGERLYRFVRIPEKTGVDKAPG